MRNSNLVNFTKSDVLVGMAYKLAGGSHLVFKKQKRFKFKPIYAVVIIPILFISSVFSISMFKSEVEKEIVTPVLVEKKAQRADAIGRIEAIKDQDVNEKMRYYTYALYNQQKLPAHLRSPMLEGQGRQIIAEISNQWESLSPATQKELSLYFGPISKIRQQLQ